MEGRPTEDTELVESARTGDAEAYAELVRRHQALAVRVAYFVTGSSTEAEEAAQDAFVKAYRALDRFRPGAPFRPWLLTIVRNEARNRLRAAGRRSALRLRLAGREVSGDAAPSPEALAVDRETAEHLLAALDRLTEKDRTVIGYRYLLDLSEAETAELLDVRPGTVKSRLSRALDRLRVELRDTDLEVRRD